MAENEIFWLGGKPGQEKREPLLADTEEFVSAIRAACESKGCDFQRLISAQGAYGTWLVEFMRDNNKQRVLWNGKDKIMVLQQERANGGWDEPRQCTVAAQDQAGFVAGVHEILRENSA